MNRLVVSGGEARLGSVVDQVEPSTYDHYGQHDGIRPLAVVKAITHVEGSATPSPFRAMQGFDIAVPCATCVQ